MPPVVVRKSLIRQVLLMAAGTLLVLASVDIVFGHWVSSPPEVDAETGEVNTTGRSQQRTDALWGSLLAVGGAALFVIGGIGALWHLPVAVISDDGIDLRVGGPRTMIRVPWSDVTWVHSGSDGDDERMPPRVLLVHVADRDAYPASPWGAAWDGNTLMVDAGSWTMRPADVVIHANVALTDWRRRQGSDGGVEGPRATFGEPEGVPDGAPDAGSLT